MRAWLALGLLLWAAPAVADVEPSPAPPIVFDANGRGVVREQASEEPLRAVQYAPQQGELHPVHGRPVWARAWWDYDEAGLYLFGDPYYGRKYLDTLNRVQWPGWCP